MNKLIIVLILLFFFLGQSVRGQEDNIKVSLMTCAPGTEIYALFGHTALRYEDKARGEDWVFNYGMFSFNTPHFIYRFVKGETDYELGVTRYPYFESSYAMRGSSVYQQTLNLTISENRSSEDCWKRIICWRIGFTVIIFSMIIALPVRVM